MGGIHRLRRVSVFAAIRDGGVSLVANAGRELGGGGSELGVLRLLRAGAAKRRAGDRTVHHAARGRLRTEPAYQEPDPHGSSGKRRARPAPLPGEWWDV